jgi:mannosyltransferase OCH1-like enzyme
MNPHAANELLIPKIFHRIWVGPHSLPATAEALARSWAEGHPQWELRLWTDQNLPPLQNARVYEQTTILAQKADILRYELLALFGGVYVDTDFECLQNIEPLLGGVGYFYGEEKPGIPAIAIMGCTPEHPFARACVERIPERWPWRPGRILEETGPAFYARAIPRYVGQFVSAPLADPRSGKEAGAWLRPPAAPPLVAFHPWVFYPYYLGEPWRREAHPCAYAVHHWQKSWG